MVIPKITLPKEFVRVVTDLQEADQRIADAADAIVRLNTALQALGLKEDDVVAILAARATSSRGRVTKTAVRALFRSLRTDRVSAEEILARYIGPKAGTGYIACIRVFREMRALVAQLDSAPEGSE